MNPTIQAIYEQGLLRPLEALDLKEKQVVTLVVSPVPPEPPWIDSEYLAECQEEAEDDVTLEEVRAALAILPGSLTEDFIAEREDR